MVKKIKLDFSKVEERSGWNTKLIPEGLHKMKVESVEQTEAQDGTDMLVYALRPAEGKYKSRLFPYYCKLQPNQLWKLRDLLVAAGQTVPKRAGQIDIEAPVGKFIAAEVGDATGQYSGRSEINNTYGLDILDEVGDEQDEDDEEYDDDEEVEEDDEVDEEDEEGEDLSTLTIVELRKMAKPLGIDTNGLKKDELIEAIEEAEAEADDEDDEDEFDDEDLEDEDLEDEEFEDDEEEDEEPAPRRRSAPAKRPAPKAAPARATAARRAPAKAAPVAKRTVRRR